MPASLIDKEARMGARRDLCRDLGQMQVHRFGVAGGQNEPGSLALLGADGAKNIGRCRALIFRGARARAALGPASRDLVFLADTRFVCKPDLYLVAVDSVIARDFVQADREVFLKSSIAPSACA